MTIQVNVHEAKTRLSELLQAVERGEEVIIARAGKPVARIAVIKPESEAEPKARRELGWMKGKWGMDNLTREEWLELDRQLDAEIQQMFDESEIEPK
jgi:prevent-host-death family protein